MKIPKQLVFVPFMLCTPYAPAFAQADVRTNCWNPYSTGQQTAWVPCSAIPIVTAQASGTSLAVSGSIAAAANHVNYLCEFNVSAIGGSAAIGPIVVSGLVSGSLTFQGSSSATGTNLTQTFSPCIPASAANTGIVVTTTAAAGATAVNINMVGMQQ